MDEYTTIDCKSYSGTARQNFSTVLRLNNILGKCRAYTSDYPRVWNSPFIDLNARQFPNPMLYDPATTSQLKPWLVRTLEPICDAEPGALADYILALLKHNVPESEMRQELAVQLDEFLEKECSGFIDTLFTVLRTKSYMPYVAAEDSPPLQVTPLDNPDGIPIPLDGLLTLTPSLDQQRPRKRSNPGNDSDGRPHKGPRLNNDTGFSRYGDDESRSTGGWVGMHGYTGPLIGGMNPFSVPTNGRQSQGYQPPDQKRGICRDYHNSGYCARGSMCKYSHGDDAVVPGQLYPGALPFLPMFPGTLPFMPNTAYDPHEARMDMRPRQHQRAPLLPRIQQEDGSVVHPVRTSGELPVIQDLTPNIPPSVPMPPPEPLPSGDVSMQNTLSVNSSNGVAGFDSIPGIQLNGHQYPLPNPAFDVDSNSMSSMQPPAQGRGGFRGRGRGGRGTFGGEAHSFRPEKRGDRTLVVEKIPEDNLSLDQVNEWFKRFGTVTNVAIDTVGGKALVSFEKHDEARAAWRSEEAVFGNRFVKVFWHKPMEGHGQVGARMLAASAPLVANMANKEKVPTPSPSTSTTSAPTTMSAPSTSTPTSTSRKVTTPTSNAVSALAVKQQQLEQKIAEQKTLMSSLEKASPEVKKDIMTKLRKLGEEMTSLTSSSSSEMEVSKTSVTARNNSKVEQEKKEKDRLDKELEMRSTADETSTTEELKAKLERLKAEAASLGLDSSPTTHYRGGYRGRPLRGRGYFRGAAMRGGPPRASMKLDNRPKKLLVKDVSEEHVQTMRDWFETTGQLDSVEAAEAGSNAYIVSFKSRSAAEQGLAKGSNIPIVGPVQISWHTGKESTSNSTSIGGSGNAANSSVPSATPTTKAIGTPSNGTARIGSDMGHHSPIHLQEEEVVASGWGVDGDEADGMGLL